MPCFHPLPAWRTRPNVDGKSSVVFTYNPRQCWSDRPTLSIPCGQCIGCRLERSRQWAIRAVHESQLHDQNCFITLTYSDDHLPPGATLVKRDVQLFLKRLRKARGSFRTLYCGEYGETTQRPHYHALLFGLDFNDKQPLKRTGSDEMIYSSAQLDKVWGLGHCSVGALTFESAAYVARYVVKKITGDAAEAHYAGRLPEFMQPSLKPGIGSQWLEKFRSDVYPSDQLVVRDGIVCSPPRYYDKQQEAHIGEDAFAKHKSKRRRKALKHKSNNTRERLAVREEVQASKLKQLKRGL